MTQEDKDRQIGRLVREYQDTATAVHHVTEKLAEYKAGIETARPPLGQPDDESAR